MPFSEITMATVTCGKDYFSFFCEGNETFEKRSNLCPKMGRFRAFPCKCHHTGTPANKVNVRFVWMTDANKSTVENNVLSALF